MTSRLQLRGRDDNSGIVSNLDCARRPSANAACRAFYSGRFERRRPVMARSTVPNGPMLRLRRSCVGESRARSLRCYCTAERLIAIEPTQARHPSGRAVFVRKADMEARRLASPWLRGSFSKSESPLSTESLQYRDALTARRALGLKTFVLPHSNLRQIE